MLDCRFALSTEVLAREIWPTLLLTLYQFFSLQILEFHDTCTPYCCTCKSRIWQYLKDLELLQISRYHFNIAASLWQGKKMESVCQGEVGRVGWGCWWMRSTLKLKYLYRSLPHSGPWNKKYWCWISTFYRTCNSLTAGIRLSIHFFVIEKQLKHFLSVVHCLFWSCCCILLES